VADEVARHQIEEFWCGEGVEGAEDGRFGSDDGIGLRLMWGGGIGWFGCGRGCGCGFGRRREEVVQISSDAGAAPKGMDRGLKIGGRGSDGFLRFGFQPVVNEGLDELERFGDAGDIGERGESRGGGRG